MKDAKQKKLTASQEDYLEAIYQIAEQKMAARPKDIAGSLGVKASSVTNALKNLAGMGLINYAPYDFVTLTDTGKELAKDIYHRHTALQNFLVKVLGIDSKEADQAACKMEHSVPKNIIDRLVSYAEYVTNCPKGAITWESGFGYYCNNNCSEQACKHHHKSGD